MKLRILGTAAAEGWPGLFCECGACRKARAARGKNIRTRTSLMIGNKYKIDFPPDTYMHVLRDNIDLTRLEHLLISHGHPDHFYPEDLWMRREPFAYISRRRSLTVYGDRLVIERMQQLGYDWASAGVITRKLEPYTAYEIGEMRVTPLSAAHFPEGNAFNYVCTLQGKTLLYGIDSGPYSELTWNALKEFKLDVVLLDCTNGSLPDSSTHTGVRGVVSIKRELIRQGSATEKTLFVATHFSHNGGLLHEELKQALADEGIVVAYDGMEIQL